MSKVRGCGLAFLAVVAVCGLGGFAIIRFGGSGDQKRLDDQYARAVKLGLPADFKAIWPAPKNPAQNAAPYYTALAKLKPNPISVAMKEADKMGYPIGDAEIAAFDAAIRPANAELAKFEAAANLPECRFQRKASIATLFPEFAHMKDGVKLLAFRARREAAGGDPVKAMRTLDSAAKVSAQVGQESILIGKLVQIALQAIVIRSAQEILSDSGKRADVRTAAGKMLADLGPPPNMKDGMVGEWMFQRLAIESLENNPGSLGMVTGMSDSGENRAAEVAMGLMMKMPITRVKQELNSVRLFLDYYEGIPSDPTQVQQAREASRKIDAALNSGGTELTLAKIIMPVFAQANDAAAKAVAERRAFAALLSALDAPTPPKWLPVKGAESIDPFTGERLLYKASPKEIRIWSVGPDGLDDGGLLKKQDDNADVTAYWPYPKSRPKKR